MLNPLFLRSFLSVYRTGSQTAAAEELCLTQPAISQHIKHLENLLKKSLFIREGKLLKPTVVAHQLAFKVSSHLDALEDIQKTFGGTVYLGGIAEFFAVVIAPNLSGLIKKNINIKFEIGHDILLEKLLHNQLDLAQFCAHVVHPGVEVELLYKEEYVLVGASKWKNKNLDNIPWVAYDESLLFIKEYYQTILNKNFSGRVILMIKDLWSIMNAVAGGAGITILPLYFCKEFLKNKKLIILHKPKKPLIHHFYLAWKDGALRNPNVALVREVLKSRCSSEP